MSFIDSATEEDLEVIARSDDLWAVGETILSLSDGRTGWGWPARVLEDLAREMKKRGGKRKSVNTLRLYRDTVASWGPNAREGVPFSIHKLARERVDREALLDWYESQSRRPTENQFKSYMANPTARLSLSRQFTCYRFYDGEGDLLYVGRDSNWPSRRRDHTTSPWWGEVRKEVVHHYDDEYDMVEDEANAIDSENPRHNRKGGDWATLGWDDLL